MDSTLPAITWNTKTYLPLEPEALFHYLADFTSTRNWDPSVTDGLLLPESRLLPNGPIDVGSQFELQFKIGWSISQFDYKIIEYAPPHQLTLISEGRGYTIYDHIQISPDLVNPAHSVLEYKLTFHYKNPHFFAIWLGKRAIRYFAAKAIKNLS